MTPTDIGFCILFCIFCLGFLIFAGLVKLAHIATMLADIRALLYSNAPNHTEPREENVSLDELCRRFRVKLELAQHQKRRR